MALSEGKLSNSQLIDSDKSIDYSFIFVAQTNYGLFDGLINIDELSIIQMPSIIFGNIEINAEIQTRGFCVRSSSPTFVLCTVDDTSYQS